MKLFRLDIIGSRDPYLIAKFFRANSAQEAMQKCKDWLGSSFDQCRVSVTLDEPKVK